MNIKAFLKKNDKFTYKDCQIAEVIELDDKSFSVLIDSPQKKNKQVADAINVLKLSENLNQQACNCILVLGKDHSDGIVYSISNAKDCALIADARIIYESQNMNPVLRNFNDNANKIVNEIIEKACKCNDGEKYVFGYDKLDTASDVDISLILKMLSESDKVETIEESSEGITVYPKSDYLFNNGDYKRTLTEEDTGEISSIEAYNRLWLFDREGGKQADLSLTQFKNLSFFAFNLNNSIINNSEFRDCNLNSLSCCEAEIKGSVFINCDMRDCAFEKSIMTNCKFINCDFSSTTFEGADLSGSAFYNCEFLGTDFDVAYMEGCEMIDNRDDGETQGVPFYDKQSWDEAMDSLLNREPTMQEVT